MFIIDFFLRLHKFDGYFISLQCYPFMHLIYLEQVIVLFDNLLLISVFVAFYLDFNL